MEDPISEMRRILSAHPQCVVVYMNMGTFTAFTGMLFAENESEKCPGVAYTEGLHGCFVPDTHPDALLGQYMVMDGKEIRLSLATPEGDAHVVDSDWSVIQYHYFPVMSI